MTDAFPFDQRGLALGTNQIAGIAGQFIGLVAGGLLAALDWGAVFLVEVPVGVFGTVWAYRKLRDTGDRHRGRIDLWGNVTFAVGLGAILSPSPPAFNRTETRPWAGRTPRSSARLPVAPCCSRPSPALVVIDVQKGIVSRRAVHSIAEIVQRAASLATAFRRHRLPVVLVNVAGGAPGRTEAGRGGFTPPPDLTDLIADCSRSQTIIG